MHQSFVQLFNVPLTRFKKGNSLLLNRQKCVASDFTFKPISKNYGCWIFMRTKQLICCFFFLYPVVFPLKLVGLLSGNIGARHWCWRVSITWCCGLCNWSMYKQEKYVLLMCHMSIGNKLLLPSF